MTVDQQPAQNHDAERIAFATGIVTFAVLLLVLVAGIPQEQGQVLQGAAVGAVPGYYIWRRRKHGDHTRILRELSDPDTGDRGNRLAVTLVVTAVLLALDSLVGAIVSYLVSTARLAGGLQAMGEGFPEAFSQGLIVIGYPVLIVTLFLVGVRAGHQLPRNAAPWLALAVVLMIPLRLLFVVAVGESLREAGLGLAWAQLLIALAVGAVIFFVVLWLGSLWSRRSREAVAVARYYRRLDADDRRAALEMLRTASGPDASRSVPATPEPPQGSQPASA